MKWPLIPLGDLAEFIRNGASIPQSKDAGGVPITRIESIAERFFNPDKCGYANVGGDEYLDYRLQYGDILVSHINSEKHLAKCAIFEDDGTDVIHGMNLLCLRPAQNRVFPKFLHHCLSSPEFLRLIPKITKKSVNQASFTVTAFKALEVPLPSLPEQKRIAAILDKVDAIRRKRQQAIQLADDFLRAVFLDMFGDPVTNPKGWEVSTLGQVSTFENGDRSSNYPSGDDLVSRGVLFLSTKNIVSDTLNLDNCQYITEEKYRSLSRGKAKKGDLIITLRGTLGSCCVFESYHEEAFINAQMMIVRPLPVVSNLFLHDLLVSKPIKNHLHSLGQGAAVPQLTASQLKELVLTIPPLALQIRYEKIRGAVLSGIEKMNCGLESVLFEAISEKAFRGGI